MQRNSFWVKLLRAAYNFDKNKFFKHVPPSISLRFRNNYTGWKVSKYGVFSGPYFPVLDWIRRDTLYLSVFSPNVWKCGPEKTPYLDTFRTVLFLVLLLIVAWTWLPTDLSLWHQNDGRTSKSLLKSSKRSNTRRSFCFVGNHCCALWNQVFSSRDSHSHFRLWSLSQVTWIHQNTKGFLIFRSSHRRCFVKKGVLKNSAIFTGKHRVGVSFW